MLFKVCIFVAMLIKMDYNNNMHEEESYEENIINNSDDEYVFGRMFNIIKENRRGKNTNP